jgi:hypothetical protein
MPDLAGTKAAYYGFTGLIDSNGATRIATALNAAVNNGCDEVHLVMSSLGGYVADGIYLYNHMRALPVKVVAYNAGSIASIAVAVFVSATERYCSAHALFMIHPTTMPSREGMTWGHLESSLQAALAEDQRTESNPERAHPVDRQSLGCSPNPRRSYPSSGRLDTRTRGRDSGVRAPKGGADLSDLNLAYPYFYLIPMV